MIIDVDTEGRIELPLKREYQQVAIERVGEAIHILPLTRDIKEIYMEIASTCNLTCKTCMRQIRKKEEEGLMDRDLYLKILEELASLPSIERLHFGGYGEPLLHPQLPFFIKKAKERGITVSVSSNGTLLTKDRAELLMDSGLDSITISLDSTRPLLFSQIRVGGELVAIQKNLKDLKEKKREEKKSRPYVEAEMVVMKCNIHELKELKRLAPELGIGHILITHLLAHNKEMWKEVLYQEKRELVREMDYWPLEEEDFLRFGRLTLPRIAWGSERVCSFVEKKSVVINWQGNVSPCYPLMYSYPYHLFGRDKEVTSYEMGNCREEDLLSIWQKEEYVRFRKKVEDYRFPSCHDCSIGETCTYAKENEDCWGNSPSCADCLWSQRIVSCP